MLSEKLATNYHALDELERLSLVGKAIARDDQAEVLRLTDSASQVQVSARHHFYQAQSFDQAAAGYLIDQLSRATRLYALLLPSINLQARRTQIARLVAYDFLQHQRAWSDFCEWLALPPDTVFALSPMSEPIMRMAEQTARGIACKRKVARAIAAQAGEPPPQSADDILAQWQQDHNARVLHPDEPRDTQPADDADAQSENT